MPEVKRAADVTRNFTEIDEVYVKQVENLQQLKKSSHRERIAKIKAVIKFLQNKSNTDKLCQAIHQDFGKAAVEVEMTEIFPTIAQAKYIISNLKNWMLPKKHSIPLIFTGISAKTRYEPKGQSLIISPWNYPFYLSIYPVLYAIAAGCSVILKPSELTAHTSQFLEEMLHSIFPENEVRVFQGEIPLTTHLLDKKWGHIFFTGSPTVGKIVMKAASKHLASVSLELGGKSPCIIDHSANVKSSVQKMLWGKFVNAGQTCIAPDYVLIHESKKEEFLKYCAHYLTQFYGDNPKNSDSLARIISEKHLGRIVGLVEDSVANGAKVVIGGSSDTKSRYIAPTVIDHVTKDMEIMKEEIFGPVLPVISYKEKEEALAIIHGLDKPLSMYICSKSRKSIKFFRDNTSSGGVLVNEFLLGAGIPSVPFGGVNNSGIGKAYGFSGFVEFSNEKAVVNRNYLFLDFIYPPYTGMKLKIVNLLKKVV